MQLTVDSGQLPVGWEIKKLVEVTDLITCGVAKRPEYVDNGIPFLSARNVKNGQVIWDNYKYISEETHRELTKNNKPSKGDILYTRVGSFGEAAIIDDDIEFSIFVSLTLIKTKTGIFNSFLKYYLNSYSVKILAKNSISGSGVGNLNVGTVRNFLVPLPPLSEQKRIVAILDEAFEGIDRAIANTEKNLTNASELFESYLNAIFTKKGNEWKEKKLGEIGGKVFTGPFGSLLHKSDYVSNEIPIVNPANIEDDKIIPNFNKTVSKDIVKRLQAYILKQNDVVVGRRGEIGRCAVVREEQAGWLCGSGSFFIKPFENVDSVFLAHLLRSAVYRNKLESLSTGATMQNLSNQSLSDLVIAMPSLDEQNRITNKIDDLRTETQRLETIYRQKIAALNELKQSILQKAFTGELTADTPKTAKQEIAA
ncbi:type 1 restriction-modification system specificity subunit [Calothrix brevissima NIES-22]|nr:type 1 restriction-modification system specificity subunit [Calothrix brevissima NIES-22]